jgi:zinc transport system substrate-binding protein
MIIDIVDFMNEHDIKFVYHEQLVDPKVAKSVASQTGAELLVLHTVHNLTEQRLDDGTTYLDVMYENLEALRKGLN